MKYYRIIPDSDNYFKTKTLKDTPEGCQTIINYGTYENSWIEPLIEIVKDGLPGDFLSWAGSIICSYESYNILKNHEFNIEYLPIKISDQEHCFYALNIKDNIPLNLEDSEIFLSRKGKVISVDKYVFNKNKLKNKDVFNPEQAKHQGPIVTDVFKKIVDKNHLKGLIFKEVFEY